jgi:hypothetical protein
LNLTGGNSTMFLPGCLPILIGSLPLSDHREATKLILQYTPEIPLWPQLPKNNGEGMVRQFLSGFPGIVDEGKKYWIDSGQIDFADEMTSFYEEYMQAESDPQFLRSSRFRLDNDTAKGFTSMLNVLEETQPAFLTLKGQVTGPITTGIGAKDHSGNSIFYDENLRDMLVKHLTMKARWQVETLLQKTGAEKPIIFIDEPGLVSFGSSAFTGISKEMVKDAVGEVISGIQHSGGLAGVHICANGDWGPALDSGTDIISFDAYSYFDNFSLFRSQLTEFLARGGILAWGIIPTGDPLIVEKETATNLFNKWQGQLQTLCGFGFSEKQLMKQTLIAPACGTGSLSLELATKVLSMNRDVSAKCQAYMNRIVE